MFGAKFGRHTFHETISDASAKERGRKAEQGDSGRFDSAPAFEDCFLGSWGTSSPPKWWAAFQSKKCGECRTPRMSGGGKQKAKIKNPQQHSGHYGLQRYIVHRRAGCFFCTDTPKPALKPPQRYGFSNKGASPRAK